MSTLASVVLRDVIANLPAASIPGRIFYATDTLVIMRDNGTTWDNVTPAASAPSGTANQVYATPDGSSGAASLRALVPADVPTLNQSTTGNAATATTATSATTATTASNAIAVGGITVTGTPTTGQILTATSATAANWQATTGGSPSGVAGGDLSGTYPNPVVGAVHATGGTLDGVTIGSTTPETGTFTDVFVHANITGAGAYGASGFSTGTNISNTSSTSEVSTALGITNDSAPFGLQVMTTGSATESLRTITLGTVQSGVGALGILALNPSGGTVTAPTVPISSNNTEIATTAAVTTALSSIVTSSTKIANLNTNLVPAISSSAFAFKGFLAQPQQDMSISALWLYVTPTAAQTYSASIATASAISGTSGVTLTNTPTIAPNITIPTLPTFVNGGFIWIRVPFTSPVALTAGTKYALLGGITSGTGTTAMLISTPSVSGTAQTIDSIPLYFGAFARIATNPPVNGSSVDTDGGIAAGIHMGIEWS